MEHEFWHRAWTEGRQGWQQKNVNLHLTNWWDKFDTNRSEEVFVPLCGKSLDMLWLLDQGHRVTGNELNDYAVESFFAENDIPASQTAVGDFVRWEADELQVYLGDFFQLSPDQLDGVKLVFDRAALVALPSAMRRDYVRHMRTILAPGSRIFLVAMVYDESKMSGPPFSVPDEEVRNLFADGFSVDHVDSNSDPERLGGLAKRGLDALTENVYFIRKDV